MTFNLLEMRRCAAPALSLRELPLSGWIRPEQADIIDPTGARGRPDPQASRARRPGPGRIPVRLGPATGRRPMVDLEVEEEADVWGPHASE